VSDGGVIHKPDGSGSVLIDADRVLRAGVPLYRPRVSVGGVAPDASFLSAFGLLIAQQESPIVTLQFPYNVNPVSVVSTVANGGAVTQANAKAVLQTSAAANGSAQIESYATARYSPGQGQIFKGTGIFTAGAANSQQEIGVGTQTDGFFFGYQDTIFGLFRRQNGTDFFTAQTAWNGDRFLAATDPTHSPAGVTLDPTKGNVYFIRYQWLGFGAIRFYIEDPASGLPTLVHTIQYSNANVLPTIFNPTLPLHARAFNSANATNLTFQTASMGIYSEGPIGPPGVGRFSTGNRKTGITTEVAVFTIRNNTTIAGIANRARVHVDASAGALSGGADSQYRLVLNATLGGAPAFADILTGSSMVAVDTAGTTVTGGIEKRRVPSTGNFQQSEDIADLNMLLFPGDTLTFAASSFAAAVSANLSVGWVEEI
jgi:hypothetical protein